MDRIGEVGLGREIGEMSNSTEVRDGREMATELMEVIETVGSKYVCFRKTQRKECLNLVRRMKLLVPLLEEIRELNRPTGAFNCLVNLKKPIVSAKKLLKDCNYGSKIYLALETETMVMRFHSVYEKLNQALDDIPYEELGITEEVKEQVELMSMQLKRAKKRTETQDIELAMDLMVVFYENNDRNADIAILERLAKKLELHTILELQAETIAVHKLLKDRSLRNEEITRKIVNLLGKFKQIAGIEVNNALDFPVSVKSLETSRSLIIPHEFLCPISLEIMIDPVIVATGQTYERESIKKWLDSNHRTCPKTGQTLNHLSLAPNFALRNLITQWCERNNYELPQKDGFSAHENPSCSSSSSLVEEILSLVQNLSSSWLDIQRDAIKKIRMISKENAENRVLIANSGAVPPLIRLLSYPDFKIKENAVTALLNLSLDESNKRLIAREGGIPAIIEVLENGTDAARENAAAALFSLSVLDENKATVGCQNGLPPLVELLKNGTARGKKDAATALFNLSLHHPNRPRAVRAGIMSALLDLLEDKNMGMVDEALSILLLLVSHPEGHCQIGQVYFIRTLVDIIKDGTAKNKECATAVLLEMGSKNTALVSVAVELGVYEHLVEIARSGTSRGQRKANSLLQQMSKCELIP